MPVRVVHADVDGGIRRGREAARYLAKEMDGIVVTNDYNLNKVAAVKERART